MKKRLLPLLCYAILLPASTAWAKPTAQIDPAKVSEFMITQGRPSLGERWTARLKRDPSRKKGWIIASAPGDRKIVDRLANGVWVEHFLDTLSTLRYDDAPKGPKEKFGLHSPRFAIQVGGLTLSLGDPVDEDSPDTYYGMRSPEKDTVYKISGAAIGLLHRLRGFDDIRLRTIAPFDVHQVSEVTVSRKGKEIFYAQRMGGRWGDAKKKLLTAVPDGNLTPWLTRLLHTEIDVFLDETKPAAEAYKQILKDTTSTVITLKDRRGRPTRIAVHRVDRFLTAVITARPQAAFLLDSEKLSRFEPPASSK